ncbi:MAG: hypothetical protein OEY23_09615 [Acidimicrobiia bacterium]|nr:hypothetical protein [Acidimicrobiia bacterium]
MSSLALAAQQSYNPLGDNLLPLLVLALSSAMLFGNVVALVRPPERTDQGNLARAPLRRTAVMIGIGFIGAIWSLASLLAS